MFATKYNPVSFRQPYLAHLRLISSATTRRQPKLKKVVVDKVETSRGRLSITKIGPAKDPKIQRKSKLETVFPTSHIKGLNFPKDQHEAYHKDLEERRASVGLFSGVTHSDVWLKRSQYVAEQLGVPVFVDKQQLTEQKDFALILNETKIMLQPINKPPLNHASGPVYADFCEGNTDYRRRHGQFTSKSPIIKAVSVSGKPREETVVLDCTGGLGTDAFVLASMGFKVIVVERDPIIFTLLRDGYERGIQDPNVAPILSRMKLVHADTFKLLPSKIGTGSITDSDTIPVPDVIFLDPMYPLKSKMKALPRKEMMVARRFLPKSPPIAEYLSFCQPFARHKIVVKRPYYEPENEKETTAVHSGRNTRFEVFPGKYSEQEQTQALSQE